MLDQVRYELVDLGLPNVKAMWPRDEDRTGKVFMIHPVMQSLMEEVSKKFPMWEFVGKRYRRNDVGEHMSSTFYVYENREELGDIGYEYKPSGGTVFAIHNHRIAESRERGKATKTKDIKKVVKILAKQFGRVTLYERLEESIKKCNAGLMGMRSTKDHLFDDDYGCVVHTGVFEDYVVANWETLKEIAVKSGIKDIVVNTLPQRYEERAAAHKLENTFDKGEGVVAVIHGADYAVRYPNTPNPVEIFSSETLPEWIKRGVGMLKLVEPNTMISNIGYKINDSAFYVMKGDE